MDSSLAEEPVFRAAKRRKVFRRRDESPLATETIPEAPSAATFQSLSSSTVLDVDGVTKTIPLGHDEVAGDGLSVAEIMRKRKQARTRKGGIEFTRELLTNEGAASIAGVIALRTPTTEPEKVGAAEVARTRFAPQTGAVAEFDSQHMTAYVDAEIARLRTKHQQEEALPPQPDPSGHTVSSAHAAAKIIESLPKQPATAGMLQEVDLGPGASARNIAMTEAAMRRMEGDPGIEETNSRRPAKIRLGRDGKPRPPPRRHRRASEDIKRDALVDALLRGNKIDMYDLSLEAAQKASAAGDSASIGVSTDDVMADAFQAEYLAELASKREIRNKPPPGPTSGPPGSKQISEIAKGPKLGGSRSARAAMHAAEKEKEKGRAAGLPGTNAVRR